jgi:hypothetical protein
MIEQTKQYQQLIAKCWADEAFKQKLLANPAAALKAEGIHIPDGVTVHVLQNTHECLNLVIPYRPQEIDDADLANVAAGSIEFMTPQNPDYTIGKDPVLNSLK